MVDISGVDETWLDNKARKGRWNKNGLSLNLTLLFRTAGMLGYGLSRG